MDQRLPPGADKKFLQVEAYANREKNIYKLTLKTVQLCDCRSHRKSLLHQVKYLQADIQYNAHMRSYNIICTL